MRQSIDAVNKRRDAIFSTILEEGDVSVIKLARDLNVSELTIRRDLAFFESKHLVERYYGGVRLSNTRNELNPSNQVERIKRALAKKAAEFVNSGDIIFMNTSTTILYMINYLEDKEVTIVTNNGKAIQTNPTPGVSIILTGGEVRVPKNAMVGDYALAMLENIRASKSFLGCSGFSSDKGMSTSIHSEVSVNKKMLSQTIGPKFIVTNSAKIEHDASFSVANTDEINGIITDNLISSETLDNLKTIPNFEVIIVEPN